MKNIILLISLCALAGCAKTSAMMLDSNTVQITASTAPVCGSTGAQSVAAKRAAIETLQRGFDKYFIVGAGYRNNVRVVGHTPVTATTTHSGSISGGSCVGSYCGPSTYSGSSYTSFGGGAPIIAGSHDQKINVRMFRSGDPGAERAIDARAQLGKDWEKAVKKGGSKTCW